MKAGIVMPGKHEVQKPEKKRRGKRKRTLLKILIVIELILAVAASCAVFYISMGRIADRRGAAIMDTLAGFKGKSVSKDMDKFIEKAKEQISEKKDETVWATDNVNYRTGPGVQYDRAGTLAIYTGVKRTGVTFNDWSQVQIGDDTYYMTQAPKANISDMRCLSSRTSDGMRPRSCRSSSSGTVSQAGIRTRITEVRVRTAYHRLFQRAKWLQKEAITILMETLRSAGA